MPTTDQPDDVVLKVGSSREPGYSKKLAAAMGWRLREKGFFRARAIKAEAVNIAVKAVATCNHRIAKANVTLFMELFFARLEQKNENPERSQKNSHGAIEMVVREVDAKMPDEFLEYKVSGKHDDGASQKLAEAIAVPAKDGKGVSLKCIGAASVYRAITASIIARGILFQSGMEAMVVPTWVTVDVEKAPAISLIRLDFWARPTSS